VIEQAGVCATGAYFRQFVFEGGHAFCHSLCRILLYLFQHALVLS
jgi:hypothetical protein